MCSLLIEINYQILMSGLEKLEVIGKGGSDNLVRAF